MERKFKVLLFVVFGVFVIFGIRLFQLQILEGEKHREMLENYMTRIEKIPAPRGKIFDRNGVLIAESVPIFEINIDLKNYSRNSLGLKKKFQTLFHQVFPDIEEMLDNPDKASVNLTLNVEQFEKIKNQLKNFSFISYTKSYLRRYYGPKSLSHVIGYTDLKGEGKSGIEKSYDHLLKGKEGYRYTKIDAYGNEIEISRTIDPVPGKDLYLTIDVNLQKKLEELLSKLNKPSSAIALNPENGEILAMVSYPYFDSNIFSDGITNEEWEKFIKDPTYPLLNRAISSSYTPGSIIKPFTALTALYYDLINPLETLNCKGKYELVSDTTGEILATYKDWTSFGHGEVNMIDALKVSCNTYFYNLGAKIGIQKLSEFSNLIGLDHKTDIDIPGEISGVYPSIDWKRRRLNEDWYKGDTVLVSIGQGYVSLTPIEITMLYSLIATEGKIFKPHLLEKVLSRSIPESYETVKTVLFKEIHLSKDKWNIIKEGLKRVVNYPGTSIIDRGTAYEEFKGFEHPVAGKTGTAELGNSEATHAWFACFSPVENPSIVLVVFVDKGGYGGQVAAPIAREFLEYYYRLNK